MRSTDKIAIVFMASYNCDNTKIMAVSDDRTVRVFDAETGQEIVRYFRAVAGGNN